MRPDQFLIDFLPFISVDTVVHLILVEIGQGLQVLVKPPIDLGDNFLMISLRVGTHEEFDGEGVAVPLVELGDHTLLRVETRILLLVSDLLLELLLGGVVDLAEARILEDEDILDFIHEAGFDYSVDLMVQDEVC